MSVTLPPPPAAGQRGREYHWTADRFYRAANAGVFDDPARLELIHGRSIEKMPQSPRHTALVGHITKRLRAMLNLAVTVRAEAAIHIAFDGEPIPDVSVVTGDNLDYLVRHPTPEEVAPLVEVSVTSADYDMSGKALLYARSGIADYWIALPEQGEIRIYRDPTPDGYRHMTVLGADDAITPWAVPEAVLPVSELLGRTQA